MCHIKNKYKLRLYQKTLLWISSQEAFCRKEVTGKEKWTTFQMHQGDYKIKTREELMVKSYNIHWFSYMQLAERFEFDKNIF